MDDGIKIPSAKVVYEQRKTYSTSSNIQEETSQYQVEHLTTMVMDKKVGVASIEDGMTKLKHLENNGKIWIQDMLLQVDNSAVYLIDLECKEELNKYPMGLIQVCTSFMEEPPYVSVLALVCWNEQQRKNNLHLFHCEIIKADLIRSDIESAIIDRLCGNVKKRPETLRKNAEKLNHVESSGKSENNEKMVQEIAAACKQPGIEDMNIPQLPGTPSQSEKKSRIAAWTASVANREFDLTSGSSMEAEDNQDIDARKRERDMDILTQLMEEMKIFVSKLDNDADVDATATIYCAVVELTTLGPNRQLDIRTDTGPAANSDLPSQEEFFDIFQKSKLALTLVANQKNQLQNPSAEELLHSIFASLHKLVKKTGGPELASSVISPLLTEETRDLLEDHVTEAERLLWVSLGNAWKASREEWPQDQAVQEYTPKFKNGWEPPALLADEDDCSELCCPSDSVSVVEQKRQQQKQQKSTKESPEDEISLDSNKCDDDPGVQEVKVLAIALNRFASRNKTELSIQKNDIVLVNDHSKKWWKVTKQDGKKGFVPHNIMEIIESPDEMQEALFA
ncbi:epidermal growth factor receptor kinase substrate 8-like isoform X1 [Petromyzon marinus]|uniref:epidermal growth factor receptor kinase substrate 8-like isoform X1 n=1 Tax=Petromyzon marinus TaxID=7757 RepID=UPI003F6E6AA7